MNSNNNLDDLDFVEDKADCLADILCLTQKNHCNISITIDESLKMPHTQTIFRSSCFAIKKAARQACTKSVQSSRKK